MTSPANLHGQINGQVGHWRSEGHSRGHLPRHPRGMLLPPALDHLPRRCSVSARSSWLPAILQDWERPLKPLAGDLSRLLPGWGLQGEVSHRAVGELV